MKQTLDSSATLLFDKQCNGMCVSGGGGKGHVAVQLDEALHYKPEGRGFDFSWCHRNSSLCNNPSGRTNINDYQELFCTMINKCTIISQIITLPLHVSTLLYHPQGGGS